MQGLSISYLPRNIGGIWSPGGDIQAPPLRAAPSGAHRVSVLLSASLHGDGANVLIRR